MKNLKFDSFQLLNGGMTEKEPMSLFLIFELYLAHCEVTKPSSYTF